MGVIEETDGMPQEDVRGVKWGVDPSTLSGGNYAIPAETIDAEGKGELTSSISSE